MKKLAAICVGVVIGLLSFVIVPAQELPKEIKGGVLNGKATSLPTPEYPSEAQSAGVEASVTVDVVVDESGTVISAVAQPEVAKTRSGNKLDEKEIATIDALLRQSAEKAALEARFPPTLLSSVPIKVSGSLIYNFGPDASPFPVSDWNGKATSLPKPVYPDAAKAIRVGGSVVVRVVIDEAGNVIEATAISGHRLLRAKAVEAARGAKFSPTKLGGQPVKVAGTLTYNFVPPKKEETTN